jgi:hypothetical protein
MVTIINAFLTIGILVLSVYFYRYIKQTSLLISRITSDVKTLRQAQNMDSPSPDNPRPDFRVVIEVVDPIALACRESKAARLITDIAPVYLTREVYKQLQKEFTLAMKERGIDANVTLISV